MSGPAGTPIALTFVYKIRNMKKVIFSGLISCSLLFAAAQTNGQTAGPNGAPVITNTTDSTGLYAFPKNDNSNENVVILRWSTTDEASVDRYVVQKSTDSILFNPLHEIVANATMDPAGDSLYQDEDPYPASPTNYYRLATIFKDGNVIYTPVVRVDVDNAHSPVQQPTLLNVNGALRMENFYEQPLIVDLYDEGGAHIATYKVTSTAFTYNTANLSNSVLVYRILDEHHAFINAGKVMLQ
jgi:hypothetical protein